MNSSTDSGTAPTPPLANALLPALARTVAELTAEFDRIPPARRRQLARLADYLRGRAGGPARLNFICTHNSRRSHFGMVWAAAAAYAYGVPGVRTYSGGTEVTACNPRAVAALEQLGFAVGRQAAGAADGNPHYTVNFAPRGPALDCYSKRYDDPANPTTDFAAVLTCSSAAADCPVVPGAEFRLPLTYADPKEADGTPAEAARYTERARQIGRELLYACSQV